MSHVSVAILAGGQATRFGGRDKSALIVDGRTILERQIAELATLTDDVMVVAARVPLGAAPPDVDGVRIRHMVDVVPGSGPLGGVHAALSEARHDAVFVVACDMPYVTAALAGHLASLSHEAQVVVPQIGDRFHPLCAVYSRSCLDRAAELLAERRLALVDLMSRVSTRVVTEEEIGRFGAPSRLLANVNTPAEYAGLEALPDHKL